MYWHHFDPPWREREHHDLAGMIALCGEHHAKADAGAYTKDQLRSFKSDAMRRAAELKGRFDWMRRQLLAIVGGNYYYETPVILQIRGQPAIWFSRDLEGYFLLNVRMLTSSKERRLEIADNFWLATGTPDDLECPPSGRLLRASYANGDAIRIEFYEVDSPDLLKARHPEARPDTWGVPFPITAVEVQETVGGTGFVLGPKETSFSDQIVLRGNFVRSSGVAIALD